MVSGAICWWGKTRLHIYDEGTSVNAAKYLQTLQKKHIPDLYELFEGDGFVWQQVQPCIVTDAAHHPVALVALIILWVHIVPRMVCSQDGASSHTAKIVTDWLDNQPFHTLRHWPANSPDLNIMENVWGMMVQALGHRVIQTEDQLRDAIFEEWDNIGYDKIRALYRSLRDRFTAVVDRRGEPTRY